MYKKTTFHKDGTMPHDQVMRAIELLGTKVAPIVREEVTKWEAGQ
ncbi:hypothetical protein ACFSCZ_12435 [Siminovitchia sediminis]|uniref:Uncharacterized protein n=1 Tax=Siminovitchia sediminis TaxID=1274353 RepID=A0ABW4KL79_9BACI